VGLTPLDHFLQKAMLVAELDKLGPDADAVTMMTLHNAKGLEFPVVFITGLEDGLFPLAKAFDDPPLLEEERRLFYVGITRAEKKLFLTHAEGRTRNGEYKQSKASSFLQAIPESMLEQHKTIKVRSSGRSFMQSLGGGSQWGNSRARGVDHPAREQWLDKESAFPPSASQRRPGTPVTRVSSFEEAEVSQDAAIIAVGSRVKHRKFGSGVIAELAGAGRDLKAKIDFDDEEIGRKTLVVAQANLERDIE
jgi:DNA helicase-2/ATP-dependent DNA helicase PcrA